MSNILFLLSAISLNTFISLRDTYSDHWADANGFKFSTTCVHFCRLRKHHLDSKLFLNGDHIPVVEEVKLLGIISDKKTFSCFIFAT